MVAMPGALDQLNHTLWNDSSGIRGPRPLGLGSGYFSTHWLKLELSRVGLTSVQGKSNRIPCLPASLHHCARFSNTKPRLRRTSSPNGPLVLPKHMYLCVCVHLLAAPNGSFSYSAPAFPPHLINGVKKSTSPRLLSAIHPFAQDKSVAAVYGCPSTPSCISSHTFAAFQAASVLPGHRNGTRGRGR
ncbi:hypothetical protein AB1N83_007631 [Pleurotus pulmonarius]